MQSGMEGRVRRHVRLETLRGRIDGDLIASAVVRTLDDINVVARQFVTLHDATALNQLESLASGPISIAKSSVICLVELSKSPLPTGGRIAPPRLLRAPVQLWVRDFSIHGFLHVQIGGDVMVRLNQTEHPFIALTSATVEGPDGAWSVPFLALNRTHILAAQALTGEPPQADDAKLVGVRFEEGED